MINSILKRLQGFFPKKRYSHIDIELPVSMTVSGGLLRLRIKETRGGYTVFCPDNHFSEANESQEWYFNAFMKHDTAYHYDVDIKGGVIYKDFEDDFSPTVAVSHLVHFFVLFDNFIINNEVIGNEDNFQ